MCVCVRGGEEQRVFRPGVRWASGGSPRQPHADTCTRQPMVPAPPPPGPRRCGRPEAIQLFIVRVENVVVCVCVNRCIYSCSRWVVANAWHLLAVVIFLVIDT